MSVSLTMNSETAPPKRKGNQQLDDESTAIIYQGISLNQAVTIFAMDIRDIKAKIHGRVLPCGMRSQNPVYQIRDLAPYLCKPAYDLDEFIQRMSIADLPPILRKEYWAGLRSRQLYEKEAAELWPTQRVMEVVSELFKTLRMSLLMTREAVERESELTPRQRDIIASIIDQALEDANAKTVSQFSSSKSNSESAGTDTAEESDEEEL
jgi:hypothetical protein